MKCIIVDKSKIIITNIIVYCLIFALLYNSKLCISSISTSIDIFISKLLPSIFPYVLMTELIINFNIINNLSYGFSNIICKLFHVPLCAAPTIVISYLLGYPNAAKHISKLYDDRKIDTNTANKLLAFTNNANPSYIIGTIGISIFNNIDIGILLALSHFLASILLGIVYCPNNVIIQHNVTKSNSFKQISSPFKAIIISIINSAKTMVIIFTYTVIFSLVPILIFGNLNLPSHVYGLIVGIFELSNGINIISLSNIDFNVCIYLVSFILSFSSLMIIIQIYSFIYNIKIKFKQLIYYKLLHGVFSLCITYALLKLPAFNLAVTVFSNNDIDLNGTVLSPVIYFFIAIFTTIILLLTIDKRNDK